MEKKAISKICDELLHYDHNLESGLFYGGHVKQLCEALKEAREAFLNIRHTTLVEMEQPKAYTIAGEWLRKWCANEGKPE